MSYKTKDSLSKISEELTLGILAGCYDPSFDYYAQQTLIRFLRMFNEGEMGLLDDLYLCGKTHPLMVWLGRFEIEIVSDEEEYQQVAIHNSIDSALDTTQEMITHFEPICWN